MPLHPWWWVEGRYLCSWEDVHTSPRVILGRMDYLTRVAAGVPWERLADPREVAHGPTARGTAARVGRVGAPGTDQGRAAPRRQ